MHQNTRLKFLLELVLLLVTLLTVPFTAQALEEDLLEPDAAFRISGRAESADRIRLEWDIAKGYYLYQSKFQFRSVTPGIELDEPETPPGELKHDEFFGDMHIYRDQVSIPIHIQREPGAGDLLKLETRSQGCADQGICYPPHSQSLTIQLAAYQPGPERPAGPAQKLQAVASLNELGNELGLGGDDDLLPADQAFQFTASVEDPSHLRLNWQVAPKYYMYRGKIKVGIKDAAHASVANLELPPGITKEDEFFGRIQVYYGDVEARLKLLRTRTEATDIVLQASYQGCAERGVCYPVINKELPLSLPAMTEDAITATGDDSPPAAEQTSEAPNPFLEEEPTTEQDRIAATMSQGSIWLVIVSFFIFGLLLAFTPCVFPMIPILSGIIAGQKGQITTRRGFTLSLVYVLAMAITYTVAGILAGLFGANLQAAFQDPWILSLFASVFVLLALSMFGFYDLQLPSSLQSRLTEMSNRQRGGQLVGVAIMGLLSALIVGPCVAPPLAGALIYIGQTGDAVLGGIALFALSMGMGAPLIALGASAGKLLPKAGPWMDAVKAVFGVGLLAVAIVLLERIVPEAIAMLLWGILLIVSAVYMGALKPLPIEVSGFPKLWKGLGIVLFVYGILMLVGVAAGGKDTLQPLRGVGYTGTGGGQTHLAFERVKTVRELEQAVASASAGNKPVMLDFYADWCVSCKELEKYTFSDPAVIQALEGFVLLQADVTANDAQDQELLQGHFGLPGPPAIMFYDRDGRERKNYRVVGFMEAGKFAEHVRRAVR